MRLMRLNRGLFSLALMLAVPGVSFGQSEPIESGNGNEETEQPAEEAAEEAEGPTLDERLDSLLSEVSAYAGHESQRCLSTRAYRTVKILNTEYLLFSRGSRYWLNKLKRECESLKFNDLPVFESRGTSSLCENDPFYPTNSSDIQYGLSGGRPVAMQGICYLGSFEAISAEQAALLTERK